MPRAEWQHTSVQAVMLPLDRIESAAPEEPVQRVLERMQAQDINQMPVMAEAAHRGHDRARLHPARAADACK